MRFLLDEGISPLLAPELVAAGHDVTHVHEIGLTGASDPDVLGAAESEGRVLITLDTDFGTLIAHSRAELPSVVLFRGDVIRRPTDQAKLLLVNLDQISDDLDQGAVVVIGDSRIRVRPLPIR